MGYKTELQGNNTDLQMILEDINNLPTASGGTPVEQATPSISVSSSGLITANAVQEEGYVSAGVKSSTKQLTIQPAKTITPTTEEQIAVSAGTYVTGDVKVAAMIGGDTTTGSGTGVTKTSSSYMIIPVLLAEATTTLPNRYVTNTSAKFELNS